ncbi:hypothetical protein RN001_001129 [Aquatica leii]|uniref:Mutator-like transposase domain-containing protein n=1 Tax=Aquatica leii TaxID=1421715 RepID=A0AAN7PG12_9COLE|nr:hypothetical protein RN001_001129 [Aquatica leii]
MCGKTDVVRTGGTDAFFGSTNRAVVIATVSIEIGYTQLAELAAAMDIPQISNDRYLNYHNSILPSVHNLNQQLMSKAAKKEGESAEEKNESNIPIISVITDGAWGKRSYRRNYSALSGVASIIGVKSKKVFYINKLSDLSKECRYSKSRRDYVCNPSTLGRFRNAVVKALAYRKVENEPAANMARARTCKNIFRKVTFQLRVKNPPLRCRHVAEISCNIRFTSAG